MTPIDPQQFVASPACIPQMTLAQILPEYQKLGFHKFELFSGWCSSHVNVDDDPAVALDLARRYGFEFTSFHLPPITKDFDASLARAIQGARYAQAIGASVMLYKADSRENYINCAKPFLDALDRESIHVTPVLQNHKGTPITTLDDFRAILHGIDDPRMKTLLEVGHFRRVNTHWRDGYELLKETMALVHINEIDPAGQSAPFGTGNSDLLTLIDHLAEVDYRGNIVVELELATSGTDIPRTLRCLGEAMTYLKDQCIKGTA